MKQACHFFNTAIGVCALCWSESGITALGLPEKTPDALRRRFPSSRAAGDLSDEPYWVADAVRGIAALLEQGKGDLSLLPLDMEGVPPFHRKVYEAVRKIEAGSTSTYGEVASQCGSPAGGRAVGQAMARNPFPLIVPCHRVLSSGGAMTGFSAYGGVKLKRELLEREKWRPAVSRE